MQRNALYYCELLIDSAIQELGMQDFKILYFVDCASHYNAC